MRVLVVIGTRPEAIKLWPVIRELRGVGVDTIVCATGQHRELLTQTFASLGLAADITLVGPPAAAAPDSMTSALTLQILPVIHASNPNWVIVQGDTTSALAAARAASIVQVPLAHVEAGLRTFDPRSPWPEELNRCEITRLADLHFAPTPRAASNLRKEGVRDETVLVTGNTAIDALQAMNAKLDTSLELRTAVGSELGALPDGEQLILVTAHRRENIRIGFGGLVRSLLTLAARQDVHIILPMHPNPAIRAFGSALMNVPNISVLPPLSYPACLALMRRATLLITDSGGLQEEAPSLGLPMLVTRISTERPEALECGAGRLIAMKDVAAMASALLDDAIAYGAVAQVRNPFGDGHAAPRIVRRILQDVGLARAETAHVWSSFS